MESEHSSSVAGSGVEPTRFSGVEYKPVSVQFSLQSKLFVVIVLVALVSAFAGVCLSFWVHRIVLASVVPLEELTRVSKMMISLFFLVGIATVGISAAIAWLLARNFTRPITKLVQGMQRVFHDDLSVRVETHRRDEFGSLVTFFNSMLEKLREVNERNASISQLKSQFVSVAAHQLRTPLTGLKWSLQWLLDEKGGGLTELQRQTLKRQSKATGLMINLVNELLDVAVVEEGRYGYSLRSVDIGRLTREVIDSFVTVAKTRSVAIVLRDHARAGLAVVGDPVQLKLALSNLIDNAIRYTKPKGRVVITLSQGEDWLTVVVADTGIGIPESERKKLFTKFYRASNARLLQPDGTGLGLFMVRNIVEGHGGKISVDSNEQSGTTFTLTLPLRAELVPRESLSEGIAAL